ncbi:hypothetical protein COL64_29160 [Bacillus toyonensis]|uniref:hypothetical protein n=1 Tax=Bacillus toyonensis TaxID=155322 RepID=UPI000BEE1B86|nr:hypothetical protein [Bacillus toyonensis]PED95018.1 hypothetical protein CON90_10860 [Bacillus toyonensis]PEL58625.1 hypothetical protein CN633_15525 [Bacillus toyonensis]PFZ31146.1 hypothetical protein COL64_29160 [Bacillus toyonensis]
MNAPVIESKILEKQREYLLEQAKIRLSSSATQEEVSQLADEIFYRYQFCIGKPLFQARKVVYGELPFLEDYYDNNKEMEKDLGVLFSELNTIATYLVDYFNYSQSEKDRILSIVRSINGVVSDLQMLTEETTPNTVYLKESFTNYDNVDSALTPVENRSMIHTQEGVLTLRRTNALNRSIGSKVRAIQGNGIAGTYFLSRKVQSDSDFENYQYVSSQIKNDDPKALIDGNPDTVFEYEMVNIPESYKKQSFYYDVEWAKGKEHGDLLRVKIVVQLPKNETINWINLNPYHAAGSPGTVNVYSIRTSNDGIEYQGLFEKDQFVLNQEINKTPQSYRAEDLFDGSENFAKTKFSGQGVWSFPSREAKYIEFVLEQPNSYKELLGQEAFYRRKKDSTSFTRIRKQEVPSNIVDEKYGIHTINSDYEIKKVLEAVEGWRYAIGVRDIDIMSFEFAETSEYISKPFLLEDGIKKVLLYANEKVPAIYKEKVSESNDWIQYFVSFDDIDWYRISPQHQQPVNDKFPAKVLSVNDNESDIENAFALYKQNLQLKELPKQVRLKIIMKRPEKTTEDEIPLLHTTPLVEDFALKILTEQKGV